MNPLQPTEPASNQHHFAVRLDSPHRQVGADCGVVLPVIAVEEEGVQLIAIVIDECFTKFAVNTFDVTTASGHSFRSSSKLIIYLIMFL